MLNGQKLQGPLAALEVHKLLKEVNHEEEWVIDDLGDDVCTDHFVQCSYPLMTAVYRICYEGVPATDLLKLI